MRMLSRAAFSLNDSMYNYYYPWSKTTAVGRTFITAGGGDNVFTVFRDANMYRCVNVFQLAATGYSVLRYQQNPPYAADIRDVSYRPSDSTLAVLYRGVSDTALAIYVCGDSLDISSQDFYVPANDSTGSIVYSSVSRNTNSSFTVVGQLNGRPYVWLTSLSCSESRNEILPGDNSQTSFFLWSPTRASAMLFIEPGVTLTKRLSPQTRCRRDSVDKEDKE